MIHVIVAIDGAPCHLDIAEFEDLLLDAREDETSLFVTIGRDRMFFEIFIAGPLGGSLDYTDAQRADNIATQFAGHLVGPKDNMKLMRHCAMAAPCDDIQHELFWPSNHLPTFMVDSAPRLEPFAAVLAVYAAAAAVHWALFVITIL